MDDANKDQPAALEAEASVPAAAPAAVPRPATTAPVAAPRTTESVSAQWSFANVLSIICLVAVAVLWLRMEGQISELRNAQRRLAQDVSSLKQTIDVADAPALGP